jgi:hypothetical protein
MSSYSPLHFWKQHSNNNSFSSIPENDMDKSSSSISHISNKGFSIKDILPEVSFTSEPKHQRVSSQNLDLLSPSVLFSHLRKNSKSSYHEKKPSVFHESEEMNSTRMQTSQSRRISEFDLVCKENNQPLQDKDFCMTCKKNVRTFQGISEEGSVENWIVKGVDRVFSNLCWCPEWINRYKVKICEICGNKV